MKPREKAAQPFRAQWECLVPTRLYLDDLRDAWGILAQVGSVSAETEDNVEIASFEELASLAGTKVTDLAMTVRASDASSMVLHVGLHNGAVTFDAPKPEFRGVLEELKHVMWRRWRRWDLADAGSATIIGIPLVLGVLWALAWVAHLVLPDLALPRPVTAVLAGVALILGFLTYMVLSDRMRRRRFVLLPMIWLKDLPPGFLARRGEEIVIQIIVGLGLLAVGYLLGRTVP